MIVRDHPALSLSRQCRLLSIGRSSLYYEPKGESAETLALMRRIDELFLKVKVRSGRYGADAGLIIHVGMSAQNEAGNAIFHALSSSAWRFATRILAQT